MAVGALLDWAANNLAAFLLLVPPPQSVALVGQPDRSAEAGVQALRIALGSCRFGMNEVQMR